MFLSFTRPSAELNRMWLPSKSTHTGVTCGLPSGITVARLANAGFVNKSAYFSGIFFAINISSVTLNTLSESWMPYAHCVFPRTLVSLVTPKGDGHHRVTKRTMRKYRQSGGNEVDDEKTRDSQLRLREPSVRARPRCIEAR